MERHVRYLPAGDTALVVEFGDRIDRHLSAEVIALSDRFAAAEIPGVVETVPTFRSLMVHYDPTVIGFAELCRLSAALLPGLGAASHAGRQWTLPVCYAEAYAPDVAEVAERTGLSAAKVVELHANALYHVYMLGFLPGHPYLGDLPPELALPRRETPRLAVPAGSVAIATSLSSIYPLSSPGGWHIIGRTPVRLFDPRRAEPVLFAAGDKVRPLPITPGEFAELEQRATASTLELRPD